MKPRASQSASDAAARLRAGARSLDVDLDESQLAALCRFLDELELWNARTNLVGEHDRVALVERHLLDALAAVPLLRSLGSDLRVADVGSGAGLPGIPLAIALRTRAVTLIEPRRKRASFLRSMRRALPSLGIHVVEDRAESLAARPEEVGSYDAMVSRAALDDEDLQRCAGSLLRPGGLLIAYRGGADERAPTGSEQLAPADSHRYTLAGAGRTFRLDVWTRRFT